MILEARAREASQDAGMSRYSPCLMFVGKWIRYSSRSPLPILPLSKTRELNWECGIKFLARCTKIRLDLNILSLGSH